MLSILIPVYCFDVRPLVRALWQQAQDLEIPWEICLLDDASPTTWQSKNRALQDLPGVNYAERPVNSGRAQMRNALAADARHDYLLFMDCDSAVPDTHYLARYCKALQANTVLCGGRIYKDAPDRAVEQLHWWYGSQREVRSASQRQQRPYEGFMTNNYVVPRTVATQIPFEAKLQHYGHEDTLFGLELQRRQIPIRHLDNPLLHIGLEEASSWLEKQQQAIQNLFWLHQQHPDLQTRALRLWSWLHRSGLLKATYRYLQKGAASWEKRLLEQEQPSLIWLDLLKIFWLEKAWRTA